MTEQELKADLIQIKKNHGKISQEKKGDMSYTDYVDAMLTYIGVKDPVLRDELIYEVFDQWIEDEVFTNEQLEKYLKICLNEEHLMYGIVDQNKDSIYTRTFSALFIASILYQHNEKSCLTKDTIIEVKKRFMEYYVLEHDLRGYTMDGGWAHSAAHGADVIKELARCKELNEQDLIELLTVLKTKVCQGAYVYIDREPERFCVAVRNIFERNLITKEEMISWIDSFHDENLNSDHIEEWHQKINIQNFFKTLYFALKKGNYSEIMVTRVEKHISVL